MFIPREIQNNLYFSYRKHNLMLKKMDVCKKIIDRQIEPMKVLKSMQLYHELIKKYNVEELLEIEFGELKESNKTVH